MLNENPNDHFHWKNRLEELDSLPGETFSGKTAAWEQLHQRLRGNRRRRKAAWYWIAAASLVFIMLVQWDRSKTGTVDVNIKSEKTQIKSPLVQPAAGSKRGEERNAAVFAPVSINAEKNIEQRRKKVTIPVIDIARNSDSEVYISVSQARKDVELISNAVIPIDTSIVAITPTIVKKKLKVIHINELGTPVEDEAKDDRYAERPKFHKRFSSQDIFTNTEDNSHNLSNDLFKLKLSPQN